MNIERQPKISIVLPTYNGAKYLREAIESCLNQTYTNIELIIVDDCSSDETPEIIKSYKDSRVKYIRNRTNQRLPRSLNIGFAHTTGEYLTWTSDDNQFFHEAIETMLKALLEDRSVDFVYADNTAKFLETGKTKKRNIDSPAKLNERNGIGACFLYTRKVYDALGGYDPRYELVEDYEYWIRVSKKFGMKHIPKVLYTYGEHRKSLKGSRMISIMLFDKILKYRYQFISFAELNHALRKFLIISIDTRKSIKLMARLWSKTVCAVTKISALLGLHFLILFVYLWAIKVFYM